MWVGWGNLEKKKGYSTCKGKLTKEMRKGKLTKEVSEWLTKINSRSSKIINPRHNKCVCSQCLAPGLSSLHFNQGV